MLKYYDFSWGSFLVDKSFECENASENASARFDLASAFQKDRPQNSKRSPFIPNKIKMTQFLVRVAYVFLFLTFKK